MTWTDLLRSAIKDSGLTHYAIWQETGVAIQTIDGIAAGSEPKLATAEKLATAVGLKLVRVDPPREKK